MNLDDFRNFDPKGLRERTGISQAELSIHLGIDQSQISRIEKNPKKIDYELVEKWITVCGQASLSKRKNIFDSEKNKLEPIFQNAKLIETYLRDGHIKPIDPHYIPEFGSQIQVKTLEHLAEEVRKKIRKPRIVVIGQFDVGKSYFLNFILGENILPSRLSPTTNSVVYLRHVDDRPNGLDDSCYFLSEKFDIDKGHDIEHINHCLTKKGDIKLLQEYGQHDARRDRSSTSIGGSQKTRADKLIGNVKGIKASSKDYNDPHVLVFLNSPLLKYCELVDTPGLGHDAIDTQRALEVATNSPDFIIFCSTASGFLDKNIAYATLQSVLPSLKPLQSKRNNNPLSNLIILATKSDGSVNETDLTYAIESASIRVTSHLKKVIPETINRWKKYENKEKDHLFLYERMMPFYASPDGFTLNSEMEAREQKALNELKEVLINDFPTSIADQLCTTVTDLKNSNIECYKQLGVLISKRLEQINSSREEFKQLSSRETARQEMIAALKTTILNDIYDAKHLCEDRASEIATAFYTTELVKEFLERKYQENEKEEAEKGAVSLITQEAHNDLFRAISQKSSEITTNVKKIVKEVEEFLVPNIDLSKHIYSSSGVMKGTALGGSVTAAVALVSTAIPISIPLVLAGMAIGATYSWIRSFFVRWQDQLAKDLSKALQQNGFKNILVNVNESYWIDVEEKLITAVNEIDKAQKSHLSRLANLVNDTEEAKPALEAQFIRVEETSNFLSEMPTKIIN